MKLKLTSQQNEIFETVASNVNNKWFYFPKVYLKVGNNEFEEKDYKDIPEGIKKYIESKKDEQ